MFADAGDTSMPGPRGCARRRVPQLIDRSLRRTVAWLIAIRAIIGTILLGSAIVLQITLARVVSGRSVLLPDRPDLPR